jgi:hypothetical protein
MTTLRSRFSDFLRFPKRTNDVEFISPLKIEECQTRLFGLADDKRSLVEKMLASRRNKIDVGGDGVIVYRVNDEDFVVRRPIDYRNDFQFVLYCRLIPEQNSTLVKGQLTMRPMVTALMAFWLGFAHAITTCMILSLIANPTRSSSSGIPIAFLFPLFGWSFIVFSYLAERKYKPTLIHFVQQRLLDPQFDVSTEDLMTQPKYDRLLGLRQILTPVALSVLVLVIWEIFQRGTTELPVGQYLNPARTLFPLGIGYYLGYMGKRKNQGNSLLRIVVASMIAGATTAIITRLIGLNLPVFPIIIAQQDSIFAIGVFNRAVNYGLLATIGGCLGWFVYSKVGRTLSP